MCDAPHGEGAKSGSVGPSSILVKYEVGHRLGLVLEQNGTRYVATDVNCSAGVYGGPDDHYVTEFEREDQFKPYSPTWVNGWVGADAGVLHLLPGLASRLLAAATELVNEFVPHGQSAAIMLAKSFGDAAHCFAGGVCAENGVHPARLGAYLSKHGQVALSQTLCRISRQVEVAVERFQEGFRAALSAAQAEACLESAVDTPAPLSLLEKYDTIHEEGYVIERHGTRYVATSDVNVEADLYGGPEGLFVTEFVREDQIAVTYKQVEAWMGEMSIFPAQTERMIQAAHSIISRFLPKDPSAAEKAARCFSDTVRYLAVIRCERAGIQTTRPVGSPHQYTPSQQSELARIAQEIGNEISRQAQHWSTFLTAAREEGQLKMISRKAPAEKPEPCCTR